VAILLTVALPVSARQSPSHEREVQAVFLFNFVHFVEWPAAAFDGPQSPMAICVVGQDPFGPLLDQVVKGETVGGRQLIVERIPRVDDGKRCHVLFISASESANQERILAALGGQPTLTVGETPTFAARGGMIHFLTERNRVRLEVNVTAARTAGLTISSNLLRSARIVGDGAIR
jgi:hypothetical protein